MTTVTFEETDTGTRLRLTWAPHEAGVDEVAGFEAALSSMDQGWSAGMELLSKRMADAEA